MKEIIIATFLTLSSSTAMAQSISLEKTYWKATELAGKPVPAQVSQHEPYLQFEPGGRVSGTDGCNRITGTYELKGEQVTFQLLAATQMACEKTSGTEQAFQEALTKAARLTIVGDRLTLYDATGTRLGVFAAGREPAESSSGDLTGTSWQLVKFESSDDTTLTPDDRSKYTIEFGSNGELIARIDCNRGHGTWKSSGPSQIEFGPLALTRAQCPPGSLHDQIVRQWGNIRSYVVRDGHLFLALKIDGGIYEFEPAVTSR